MGGRMTSTGSGDPVSQPPRPRPRREGGAASGSNRSPQQHPVIVDQALPGRGRISIPREREGARRWRDTEERALGCCPNPNPFWGREGGPPWGSGGRGSSGRLEPRPRPPETPRRAWRGGDVPLRHN